ncbi:hypothetical protein [Pseudorhodoferax soli]|uniref:Uncharacterized protein n=1 Tax=Pseudorhodoferax soli TaxID=545864 RepID=A0A368XXJ1_9BURK|nr:hypothetical protein [Pseudorhodoferax soli]RCW71758.1 hypothetical protein DES41_104578 [Pseudorhodoferax soli]
MARIPEPASLSADGRRALRVPLVLGALVLAATLCVPATQYLDLSTPEDQGQRSLPVLVQSLEAQGRVADQPDADRVADTRNLVAANILLRSGYLTRASVQTDPATRRPLYALSLQPEVRGCASVPQDAPAGAQAKPALPLDEAGGLAIAAVAVEKFNRHAVHRTLEWALARSVLALTGRLPELSLGPAQIRPAAVRRLVAAGVGGAAWRPLGQDDHALALALGDECRALGLATALLAMQACTDCSDPAAHALQAYGGQRPRTDAVIDYVPIVQTMAAMAQ